MALSVRVMAGGRDLLTLAAAVLLAAGGEEEEEEAEAATERARLLRRVDEVEVERASPAETTPATTTTTPMLLLRLAACGLAAARDPAEARAGPQRDCARAKEREARIDARGNGACGRQQNNTLRRR